ncbi:hypothetical protein [Paenibacillus jilunlii]|uniref:hypothetical protein n=1 Tax=Paenibacillus jilunlii TaxID=682956 RepID=UPI000B11EC4B|nr:hypothetical protein [Paenibacillus jilunlii]
MGQLLGNNGRNTVVGGPGGKLLGNNGRNAVVEGPVGQLLGNNGRSAVVSRVRARVWTRGPGCTKISLSAADYWQHEK